MNGIDLLLKILRFWDYSNPKPLQLLDTTCVIAYGVRNLAIKRKMSRVPEAKIRQPWGHIAENTAVSRPVRIRPADISL